MKLALLIMMALTFALALFSYTKGAHWEGMKGILIASAAGAISPGGPFINFPLVAALYQAGAGVGAPLAGYLAHTFFSGWVGR